MNENLRVARKFKNISLTIYFVFVILTIVLSTIFSYLFDNYWLLLGIAFALYLPKFKTIFILSIIGIIIYWIVSGFRFSDEVTFYWLSSLYGYIFQLFVQTYDLLAHKIIENQVSDISSEIKNSIKYRNDILNKKSEKKLVLYPWWPLLAQALANSNASASFQTRNITIFSSKKPIYNPNASFIKSRLEAL